MFAVDDETRYYEPEAGTSGRSGGPRAAELARRAGARLRLGEPVRAGRRRTRGPVSTDVGTYDAGRAAVRRAVDHRAVPGGPRHVRRPPPADVLVPDPPRLRATARDAGLRVGLRRRGRFVHLDGFYGFPAVDGPAGGVKVATERYEHTTAPNGRQHPASRGEASRMYEPFVAPDLPGSAPRRADRLLPVHEHAREPVRDRPPPRARHGADRVGLLGSRLQALAGDRRGGRAVGHHRNPATST